MNAPDRRSVLSTARKALALCFGGSRPPIRKSKGKNTFRVCVTIRVDGVVRGCRAASSKTLTSAIAEATRRATADNRQLGRLTKRESLNAVLEVWIETKKERIYNLDVSLVWGLYGIEVRTPTTSAFFLPCVAIERNIKDPAVLLSRLYRKARIEGSGVATQVYRTSWLHFSEVKARALDRLAIARCGPKPLALRHLAASVGEHLLAIQQANGSYLYHFSPYEAALEGTNPIRIIGCTLALGRLADCKDLLDKRPSLLSGTEKGSSWILERLDERRGSTNFQTDIHEQKLGSTAFAILSLMHSALDRRKRLTIGRLIQALVASQRPDGSFSTSMMLTGPRGNQDFAPAQAVLALLSNAKSNSLCLPAIKEAFSFYSLIDEKSSSPFFLAWQAKAWCEAARLPGFANARSRSFALLDALSSYQVVDGLPDLIGGYDIGRYGAEGRPPSFLVALFTEALIMGYRTARDCGDYSHAERFLRSSRLGLQYLSRLIVSAGEAQLYPRSQLLVGGVRKDLGSLELRCDYSAHAATCLAAALRAGLKSVAIG